MPSENRLTKRQLKHLHRNFIRHLNCRSDAKRNQLRNSSKAYLLHANELKTVMMKMKRCSPQGIMLSFVSVRFKITLGVILILHILQLIYSFSATYPSGVIKPRAVGFASGALVAVKLAGHLWLHHLSNTPEKFKKYSRYALGTSGTLLALLNSANVSQLPRTSLNPRLKLPETILTPFP